MKSLIQIVLMLSLGYLLGKQFGPASGLYMFTEASNFLLCLGLYGAVAGIDVVEFKNQKTTVFLAITVGVCLKAALIGLISWHTVGLTAIAFGCAMAQIDPLSVAALSDEHSKRLSKKGVTLLKAWSSFDDPMTVLLLLFVAIPTISTNVQGSMTSYFISLAVNLSFAGVVYVTYLLQKFINTSAKLQAIILVLALLLAAKFQLPLGMALVGLFLRPNLGKALDKSVHAAYLVATVVLGSMLIKGIDLKVGLILAVSTHLAQMAATLLLTTKFDAKDRWYLAAGQQSGITAVILAVILEKHVPGAAGSIAPAIVFINIIHAAFEAALDRRYKSPVLKKHTAVQVWGKREFYGSGNRSHYLSLFCRLPSFLISVRFFSSQIPKFNFNIQKHPWEIQSLTPLPITIFQMLSTKA